MKALQDTVIPVIIHVVAALKSRTFNRVYFIITSREDDDPKKKKKASRHDTEKLSIPNTFPCSALHCSDTGDSFKMLEKLLTENVALSIMFSICLCGAAM